MEVNANRITNNYWNRFVEQKFKALTLVLGRKLFKQWELIRNRDYIIPDLEIEITPIYGSR
jgi:hypothetical protein